MPPRSLLTIAAALALSLLGADDAAGDSSVPTGVAPISASVPVVIGGAGYLHLHTPAHITTDGGADFRLPAGYYLDEPNWGRLDAEVRRLQERETRLDAENKSLKTSMSAWQPGWIVLSSTLVVGIVTGIYLHTKI